MEAREAEAGPAVDEVPAAAQEAAGAAWAETERAPVPEETAFARTAGRKRLTPQAYRATR